VITCSSSLRQPLRNFIVAANVWHKLRCAADFTVHLVLVCGYKHSFEFIMHVKFRVWLSAGLRQILIVLSAVNEALAAQRTTCDTALAK
jgi:hypothetical protein